MTPWECVSALTSQKVENSEWVICKSKDITNVQKIKESVLLELHEVVMDALLGVSEWIGTQIIVLVNLL